MKTIEVRSQWNLEHWDHFLSIGAPHGPWGNRIRITDVKASRAALEEFKRIITGRHSETACYYTVPEFYYYTVPKQSWTLYVLSHPAGMQLFQEVNNENN